MTRRAKAGCPVALDQLRDKHIEDSHWGRRKRGEAGGQRTLFQASDDAFRGLQIEFRIRGPVSLCTHWQTVDVQPGQSRKSTSSLCVSGPEKLHHETTHICSEVHEIPFFLATAGREGWPRRLLLMQHCPGSFHIHYWKCWFRRVQKLVGKDEESQGKTSKNQSVKESEKYGTEQRRK